jgi:hypothetical protein
MILLARAINIDSQTRKTKTCRFSPGSFVYRIGAHQGAQKIGQELMGKGSKFHLGTSKTMQGYSVGRQSRL